MTHASVFSGIGGPEVAATMLGWDNLFHCEINPFGRKVLDYWYPNSKSSWTSQAARPSDEDITFERSRQTGSGVSLRAKTNTNYTNYANRI